ncbi:Sas10 C-terminal domain-containing protein [Pterulicium gracile]|uniref:Sas10 C-terminal domain-containing protein n=1 Tax=Pterulicium gracile TaxID=1884261 RepID=A0A5C3QP45_9AGAR|nr:Sas10 C-terminal domain-containing protein [Pterula gracilis]
MVRRRAPKSSGKSANKPRPVDRSASKVKKWNTVDDIPLDEEDQFYANRDKILLDGGADDSDSDGLEDEVFALKGLDRDIEEENLEDHDYSDEEDPSLSEPGPSKATKTKAKKKEAKGKKAAAPSASSESEESEEESWGQKKSAYYSSNADRIDSEDEEANELEEQEALRLQSKARETLNDDAFGLPDHLDDLEPSRQEEEEEDSSLATHGTAMLDDGPQDPAALLQRLSKTNPEALALAADWKDTANNLTRIKQMLEDLEEREPDSQQLGRLHFYYQGLLTYATTLAFYLHMRASKKYAQRPELLRNHPILARLLSLKDSLATLQELGFDEEEADDEEDEEDDLMLEAQSLWKLGQEEGLDKDELRELLLDALSGQKVGVTESDEDEDVEVAAPSPKKHKTSSSRDGKPSKSSKNSAKPVFDLVEPQFVSSKTSSSSSATPNHADAYGENVSLQSHDAADKSARRKSLRFHTSKIENASNRRNNARTAVGGDDDLPYRDRKKEQEMKLARAKKMGQGGADLDDMEVDAATPGQKRQREEADDGSEEEAEAGNGYYDLVKKKKKEMKEEKKFEYEAARAAARPDLDGDSADGPRSLTRSILKNKGLTPRRGKDVRNPRVKKKHKYEQAKKKVASQKAVYKGGLSQTGHYEGERSGISKVRKGVALG